MECESQFNSDFSLFPTFLPDALDSSRPVSNVKPQEQPVIPPLRCQDLKKRVIVAPTPDSKKRPAKKQTPKRPQTSQFVSNARPLPPKVSKVTQEVINSPNTIISNQDQLQTIVRQLQALYKYHAANQEFPEAQRIQQLLRSYTQKLQYQEEKHENQHAVQSIVSKRRELQAIINSHLEAWKKDYESFIQSISAESEKLESSQSDELNSFDSTIPIELTPQYRKRSTMLIEMRDREYRLAMNQQYNKAQRIKLAADQREQNEAENQMERMLADYDARRDRIVRLHAEQSRVLSDRARTTMEKYMIQRDQLVGGYTRRLKKLDDELLQLFDDGQATADDLDKYGIDDERLRVVLGHEKSYPIPRVRPSTAFTSVNRQ